MSGQDEPGNPTQRALRLWLAGDGMRALYALSGAQIMAILDELITPVGVEGAEALTRRAVRSSNPLETQELETRAWAARFVAALMPDMPAPGRHMNATQRALFRLSRRWPTPRDSFARLGLHRLCLLLTELSKPSPLAEAARLEAYKGRDEFHAQEARLRAWVIRRAHEYSEPFHLNDDEVDG